jgi:hypothetical protein
MPIFSRRTLQSMLNNLGPYLTENDAQDLIGRLSKLDDPDQCIPAEYELALSWAVSRVAEVVLQPRCGSRQPDIAADELFPGKKAVIEVMALSDDSLSGESSMRRTANIVGQFAETIRKGARPHLQFNFLERSGHRLYRLKRPRGCWTHSSRFFRERLTSPKFVLSPSHKLQIQNWLIQTPPNGHVRLQGQGTDLLLSWDERPASYLRVRSSMPSEAHDVRKNVLYRRLEEKADQLKAVADDAMKCIFVGDAGCSLFQDPNATSPWRVSAGMILSDFIEHSSVDIVCIFSPRRTKTDGCQWFLTYADKLDHDRSFYEKLFLIRTVLPGAYLEGAQARSWVQQGLCDLNKNVPYLPSSFGYSQSTEVTTIRVSARAVVDFLAGRITRATFDAEMDGSGRCSLEHLSASNVIRHIGFESKSELYDDDYVVISLAPDPCASPFQIPTDLKVLD